MGFVKIGNQKTNRIQFYLNALIAVEINIVVN